MALGLLSRFTGSLKTLIKLYQASSFTHRSCLIHSFHGIETKPSTGFQLEDLPDPMEDTNCQITRSGLSWVFSLEEASHELK